MSSMMLRRVYKRRATGPSWVPTDASARLWLDASDASTITIDTGVSVWADKSGGGYDAVQATPANQPTYSGGVISMTRTSSQCFTISNTLGLFENTVIAMVAKVGATTTAAASVFGMDTSPVNNPSIRIGLGGNQVNTYWNGAYVISGALGSWTASHRIHVHALSLVGGAATVVLRQDGAQVATGSRAWASSPGTNYVYINKSATGTAGHDMEIKELMVLPYSGENLANAEAYLAAKHGIALA